MFANIHTPTTLRNILRQYCNPPEELVNDFERSARLVQVAKGEKIVNQGKVCNYFVFNRKGLFRVCNITNGVEDTLLFGTSGDVFTSLHSYYAGEPSIFSLVAVEDSEAWIVSYADMKALEEKYPVMVKWMRDLLIEQTFGFEKRYLFFNNKSAEDRLHNFMRMNAVSLRRTSFQYINSIVPLKYIAQYLKITQSTLSRLRRKLVNK